MITKGDGPDPRIAHLEEINNRRNMPAETEYRRKNKEKLNRLRQELAMAALTGLLGASDSEGQWTWGTPKDVADCAVEIANEMLRALEVQS